MSAWVPPGGVRSEELGFGEGRLLDAVKMERAGERRLRLRAREGSSPGSSSYKKTRERCATFFDDPRYFL